MIWALIDLLMIHADTDYKDNVEISIKTYMRGHGILWGDLGNIVWGRGKLFSGAQNIWSLGNLNTFHNKIIYMHATRKNNSN